MAGALNALAKMEATQLTHQQAKRLAKSGKPQIKLHVLGAAGGVTGSLNLFEYTENGTTTRFLMDVGLTVENETADFQNRLPRGLTAGDINFIVISHAHLDHSGYLPKLVKDGFSGKVFVTAATADLMAIMLPDSGFLQEEGARRYNRRNHRVASESYGSLANRTQSQPTGSQSGKRQGHGNKLRSTQQRQPKARPDRQPLYTREDAVKSLSRLVPVPYDLRTALVDGVAVTFTEAGHILGAAVVNLEIGKGAHKRTFCFTGNVGRPHMPLLQELATVKGADYLMSESTYGDKLHHNRDRFEVLADIINRAHARALNQHEKFGYGVIMIPAFAVGRAQVILNDLRHLMTTGRIPKIPVFVDSPMTIRATEVHRKHADRLDNITGRLISGGVDPFTTPRHTECLDRAASEALDQPQSEPIIIVGSSGMASGGRIVQHLKARLSGAQHTVVFVGYQGTGTLGSQLVGCHIDPSRACATEVRIYGEPVHVRATVEFMGDYSGHADYSELVRWMRRFERRPKQTFLVHGDTNALDSLKGHIESDLGWKNVVIPKPREVFEL
jgi:metallo-beta-lactamase family protein